MLEMGGIEVVINLCYFFIVFIIVLMVSMFKQEEDYCYQVGINDYLVKFFQFVDFYWWIMLLVYE